MASTRPCTVDGCEKIVIARGLCPMHYARATKDGTLSQYSTRGHRADTPCKLDGCDKPGYALGFCQKHYDSYHLYGDPVSPAERARQAGPVLCSIKECGRQARAKGMCDRHYSNQRLYGHAIPFKEWPLKERLEHIGWIVTPGGCWEWAGAKSDSGYGLHSWKGKNRLVHRVAYEIHVGPLDSSTEVRHTCDNPPCLNPDHLITGSHADNMRDMAERKRSGLRYENNGNVCRNGHDMTVPGAYKIVTTAGRKPYRTCVACARDRNRKYSRKVRDRSRTLRSS